MQQGSSEPPMTRKPKRCIGCDKVISESSGILCADCTEKRRVQDELEHKKKVELLELKPDEIQKIIDEDISGK
jgi:hypothetical protein